MEEKSTYINWCDHVSLSTLSPITVLDYFCKPTNPFYDKTCNNEQLRMQGFGLVSEQLRSMEGLEYILLHAQPPDLYVVRKQHRSSPVQETPLVDYYIIRGVIYQAPDLGSIINVRLLNGVHAVRRALDEASSRGRFSISKTPGVSWITSDGLQQPDVQQQSAKKSAGGLVRNRQNDPDRPPTAFQKAHVDPAIAELVRRFPAAASTAGGPATSGGASSQQATQQAASGGEKEVSVASQQQQQQVQDGQQQAANTVKRTKLTA